jgi:hypothetical protein
MPNFQISVHKALDDGTHWSNVYHVGVADLAAAKIEADYVVSIERAVHKTDVHFVYYVVSEVGHPFTNFHHIALGSDGTIVPTTGEHKLPAWNIVKCIFGTAISGKPDFKILRLPLYTDEILQNGDATSTVLSLVNTYYTAAIGARGTFQTKSAHAYISYATLLHVFDRDLHRRRHKKVVVA